MTVDVSENVTVDIVSSVGNYRQSQTGGARLKALKNVLSLIRELVDSRELQAIHKENMMELVTIRTLISMDVFKHLPEQGSISAQELGNKAGIEEALLTRLLRMAATSGILEQNSDKTFTHTKFSRAYAAEIGPGIAFQVFYDESFQPLTRLHQYIKDNGAREPQELETCPVMWNLGKEGESYWNVMQADPERLEAFARGMRASQSERTILVDVGGGHGQTICEILKNHPTIPADRVVLEDLPKVVEAAKRSKILPEGVQIRAYDYADPQPVKDAKAYLFRRVLHSSSDSTSSKILANVVEAMAEDSVVLIADFIVPDPVPHGEMGAISASVGMLAPAGKERTIEDFRMVLDDAGLGLTGVFQGDHDNFGMIEARLKNNR